MEKSKWIRREFDNAIKYTNGDFEIKKYRESSTYELFRFGIGVENYKTLVGAKLAAKRLEAK